MVFIFSLMKKGAVFLTNKGSSFFVYITKYCCRWNFKKYWHIYFYRV